LFEAAAWEWVMGQAMVMDWAKMMDQAMVIE